MAKKGLIEREVKRQKLVDSMHRKRGCDCKTIANDDTA